MNLHRLWDGVITSSSNLTRIQNEATALRNRQEFQRSHPSAIAHSQRELVGTRKILRLSVWRDRFPVQGHVTIVRESFLRRLGTFLLYRSARLCLRTGQSCISKEMPVSCIRAHLLQQ